MEPQQNPQEQSKKYWFFGSKLNTVLLFVLIVLMVIALRWMSEQRQLYLPAPRATEPTSSVSQGNIEDLIALSLQPGQRVSGKMSVTGTIKGGYFFEGSFPVGILNAQKQPTTYGPGYATATTDWMTAGPVSFSFDLDLTQVPPGQYYIKFAQDDPSGGESGKPIRSILIPITVQ